MDQIISNQVPDAPTKTWEIPGKYLGATWKILGRDLENTWEMKIAGRLLELQAFLDFGSVYFLHRSLILESLRSSQSCGQSLGENSMVSDEKMGVLEANLDLFD